MPSPHIERGTEHAAALPFHAESVPPRHPQLGFTLAIKKVNRLLEEIALRVCRSAGGKLADVSGVHSLSADQIHMSSEAAHPSPWLKFKSAQICDRKLAVYGDTFCLQPFRIGVQVGLVGIVTGIGAASSSMLMSVIRMVRVR